MFFWSLSIGSNGRRTLVVRYLPGWPLRGRIVDHADRIGSLHYLGHLSLLQNYFWCVEREASLQGCGDGTGLNAVLNWFLVPPLAYMGRCLQQRCPVTVCWFIVISRLRRDSFNVDWKNSSLSFTALDLALVTELSAATLGLIVLIAHRTNVIFGENEKLQIMAHARPLCDLRDKILHRIGMVR